MSYKLLVVDDDLSMCELIRDALEGPQVEIATTQDPGHAFEEVKSSSCDVVVTDLELGTFNGLELTEKIVEFNPDIPVIVITAYGNMETAIAALRLGAYDFIKKPLDLQALGHTVKRAAEHRRLKAEVAELRRASGSAVPTDFIGESPGIKRTHELIEQVGPTQASVLITGESGTGKELVARALHDRSDRKTGPFVAVNCAAMPANLLESELFGHVKGAFTDAKTDREGLFVRADGGTLLLDEIGEMPVEMQAKLLRVLQEDKVRPVGGDQEIPFDVRLVAATNRDLSQEMANGRLREDLYHRLAVFPVRLP
ncbi:MAG: sigma-54 dependent transcriptional regulator, partial [Deltaproteobacteria bacterium]|nr:sigma-54 dependent transcriptional regulator [Deltaproteobacteria bacterium]